MDKLIILDAGHGGLNEGRYTTYPDKRVDYITEQINEGVLNRAVVNLLAFYLDYHKYPVHILSHNSKDTSLPWRVSEVNRLAAKRKCELYSIHHNYSEYKSASGAEIYTYYGYSKSDDIAEQMAARYERMFPELKFRRNTITKKSKEAGYYILKNTKCPAVLTEFSFMSNTHDVEMMAEGCGIENEVKWLLDSIRYNYPK